MNGYNLGSAVLAVVVTVSVPAVSQVLSGNDAIATAARGSSADVVAAGSGRMVLSRDQSNLRTGASLRKIDGVLDLAAQEAAGYERTKRQMNKWFRCIRPMGVDQVGDLQHEWGFEYDEKDGTGIDTRPALVLHRGPGRPDLLALRRTQSRSCLSSAPDPNGTGDDARAAMSRRAGRGHAGASGASKGKRASLTALERRVERLDARIDKVEAAFDRFDEWESCLSWLPVTELGHEDQGLGYRFDMSPSAEAPAHLAAVDIDSSEWDDPDYELLVFLGPDRPFTDVECGNEPGESVDRSAGAPFQAAHARIEVTRGGRVAERLKDLRRDVNGAVEDVEDLVEPVQEFVQFDECMYTVGMQNRGSSTSGYRFVNPGGGVTHRDALSFDMRGLKLPQFDIMAFSGEEPPQIECNEDAGGVNTDE